MPLLKDQTGRIVEIAERPSRIISLVPSQTELLYDLGLDDEVVAITKFCVHPEKWFRSKMKIGGTKDLKIDRIDSLQPDLIIANKEENTREQVEELMRHYPVWVSDVYALYQALDMIRDIGIITNKADKAALLVQRIENGFNLFTPLSTGREGIRTAYFIWRDPYMTAGGDTFIHSMMECCGCKNIFEHERRYPVVTTEQLMQMNCQLLLLSSEPYPFAQKHVEELQNQLPDIKILLVDGQFFSWYGSRLLHAPLYFQSLLQSFQR